MGMWQFRPQAAAACISLASAVVPGIAVGAECRTPEAAGYQVEFPQGRDMPIKLYQTDKGGRIGSVPMDSIVSGLKLCSEKPGIVSEVRLPQGVDLDLDDGKAATADDRYWVRNTQIRFSAEGELAEKEFLCERNQGANQIAGGPAGGEGCKPEGGQR